MTTLAPHAVGELARAVGPDHVLTGDAVREHLRDATEARGLTGRAEAVVLPANAEEVAQVVTWCYENRVAMTPRGGGTGYAGGCVPDGGIVLALERLRDVRSFEPLLWRGEFEAGVPTAHVQRRARENGLYFPPDPGAAEQSHIGGNVATNAGGPHAFKYGVTGAWVTGLEAVVPPGRIVRFGGPVRKDVAGYDLRSLLVGSEGTLAIITAVHLRFVPAPECALPVIAFYPDAELGGQGVQACMASGVTPAALEYLDAAALDVTRGSFPGEVPATAGFAVIAEADGEYGEAVAGQRALRDALADGSIDVLLPSDRRDVAALWRWRDGVGIAADTALGGKVSEDIAVPVEHLAEAIDRTHEIAGRHELASCSWGHAGDGNLHSTFLFAGGDQAARGRARAAADELFNMAIAMQGTVSGEHGIGTVKRGQLRKQWTPEAVELHLGVKRLFDPSGLLNPGKKAP